MNLSEQTISVLKNFSHINSGLYFQEGQKLKTVAPSKAILAEANINEEIPTSFGIYDLNRLLGTISLFEKPEIDFGEKQLILKDSNKRKSCKYSYCDASLVVRPPEGKEVKLPTEEVTFVLTEDVYNEAVKAAAVLQYPEIAVAGNGKTMEIAILDSKNQMSDEFSHEVGETTFNFKFVFKVENFSKLMSKEYNVFLSSRGLSRFDSSDNTLTYYIALEPTSTFEN
jgi:hypothetical protein